MSDKNIDELLVLKDSSEIRNIPKRKDFLDVLKMFAPGTSLRSALDDLLRARMGALIVVDSNGLFKIIEKGFRINAKFSPQRLVELAKMDGAIILSKNTKRILYANTILFPSQDIQTKETGTRHRAAERTAKQLDTIVIAISERKNKISIYYGEEKHELQSGSEVLRRATENLQILEKQREIFSEILNNLNLLELKRLVTIKDVVLVLQRLEIIKRISDVIKKYLVELGKEGVVVSMRLKELTSNLDKEEELVLRDYFGQEYGFSERILGKMDFEFLLDYMDVARALFNESVDNRIAPRGIRFLNKTNILDRHIDSLVGKFKTLNNILFANEDELLKVFENEGMVAFFKDEIYNLREKIIMGNPV